MASLLPCQRGHGGRGFGGDTQLDLGDIRSCGDLTGAGYRDRAGLVPLLLGREGPRRGQDREADGRDDPS